MSDFQREFMKAKLAKLPAMPPAPADYIIPEEEEEETDDFPIIDDSASVSSASSTSTIRPSQFARPEPKPRTKDHLEPIPWNNHFSTNLKLRSTTSNSQFNAYITAPTGKGPLFVTHHGAGSSGLSFATLASEIRKIIPSAGVLSPDARGHGETTTETDGDLSLSTLRDDLVEIVNLTKEHYGWGKLPDLILVGHSLGGAVVVNVAKGGALGSSVQGYAVLDVVEGSAIDALQSMQTYLSTRPSGFSSLSQGIEWHLKSRTIRNPSSARCSVPALLLNNAQDSTTTSRPWKWRTDLACTQPFWENWFVGLSNMFLEARGGKLLILAGTDRLDRELMIGQMQGKYQLLVIPEVGHFVHEDSPEKVAGALVDFHKRQAPLVLPPKVGQFGLQKPLPPAAIPLPP